MDLTIPPELEELILCSCCHLPYNDTDAVPKLFSCRHYFCLKCVNSILLKGNELYCVHCWKRTELPGSDMKTDNLPTHNAILFLSQNLSMLNLTSTSSTSTSLTLSSKSKPPDKSGGSCSSGSNGKNGSGNGSNSSGCGGTASSIISNSTNQSPSSTSIAGSGGSGGSCSNSVTNSNTSLSSSNTTTNVVSSATIAVVNSNRIKKGENCLTHAMPNTLWCTKCVTMICRACATSEEHRSHTVKSSNEAKENIHNDIANEILLMQKTLNEVQHLVLKQRDFLLKILESCTALKTQIETELINHLPTLEIADMRESLGKAKLCLDMIETQSPLDALKLYTTLNIEKQRLQSKFQEMYLQCKLDDLIRNYDMLFNFELIKQALTALHTNGDAYNAAISNGIGHNNPILLLANYCISQLYSRHILSNKHQQLLSNSNNNNYHAHTHQLLQHQQMHHHQQQHQQQQQQQHQQQSQSQTQQGPPHHDSLVTTVKTYADITTSSPKSNHIHHPHHPSTTQHHSANSSNSSIVGTIGPSSSGVSRQSPSSQQTQQPQQQSASYMANELNGLTVPALTIMQHHLHQQQQQQQQQHSNQLQKTSQQQQQQPTTAAVVAAAAAAAAANNLLCNPSVHVYPIYYFNIEMNGQPCGRILIEVRNDVAPKMAKNFGALTTGELGFGYKGCQIFQCWENESIITGDFELNNGRGGRSVFEDSFFMPDDTKILAIRGSVGMRRSQKRHDNLGLVGSQFRIILREMRGFTGIFAFVVEGLELVEKISQAGDSAGKPQSTVVIVSCGKYQM